MPAFYTFVNRAMHVCFDSHSLSTEAQYLKATAIDLKYNRSILDTTFHKLHHPRSPESHQSSYLSHSIIALPFFSKSIFPISKIL